MRRPASAERNLERVAAWRAACPQITLRSTFIVGFPGETDADFEATMQLVREVGYASAFSFKYSPRPGTPGAEMDGHVPEAVKDERLQRLQALLVEQQQAFTVSMVGRTMPTLIEKPGRQAGQKVGRSPWLQPVIVDEKAGEIGDIIQVRITGTGFNSLHAEPAREARG
jgi:tRNA-2-methylthio-N6-dimethylallyladenosine synthase